MKKNWENQAEDLLKKLKVNKPFDDSSILNFGQHKDKRLEDVPASYLLWVLLETDIIYKAKLSNYIPSNLPLILQQASQERAEKRKGKNGDE